ncbi:uncharacterized protein LOC110454474 [Mizuhopecten yessoensis]|uniref:uncharacterized protein LOC110454474 n=1 Tax=Mizuhopecten yessoensis TaxID=6573 RepID=UPI000B45BDF5|nr:uncharacterized protein LOC110454474 [Mizuhopecten yessoensis]
MRRPATPLTRPARPDQTIDHTTSQTGRTVGQTDQTSHTINQTGTTVDQTDHTTSQADQIDHIASQTYFWHVVHITGMSKNKKQAETFQQPVFDDGFNLLGHEEIEYIPLDMGFQTMKRKFIEEPKPQIMISDSNTVLDLIPFQLLKAGMGFQTMKRKVVEEPTPQIMISDSKTVLDLIPFQLLKAGISAKIRIHTDYGTVGECTIERTQSFTVTDTIKKKSPETKLQDLFFITSHIANSIEDADSSSLDSTSETSYQEKQEKSHEKIWRDVSTQISLNSKVDADSTSLHTTSDTSYQEKQDFHSDCKGFPFNVARLLAIKFKVEERFVVPTTDARGKHTFIIYDKEQGRDRITTEFGQKVLIRNPKSIQSEGIAITNYCREKRLDLKPTKRASLKNIIQKHTDKLFIKHSNINFISTSPVKSCWNGDIVRDEACIVIYCSSKGYVPFGEDKFPKLLTVGEVIASTDIREGYFQFGPYAYATSRSSDIHDRLKMGCQFGVEGGSTSGTIGPVVNLNGEMAFLTCAHIIYGIDQNGYTFDDSGCDIYIEQPSSTNFGSTGNRCGKVKRAVFRPNLPSSVDAAVVEITEQSRQPVSGEFAVDNPIRMQQAGFDDLPYFNSGKIHMNPNTIDSDKRMVKFGSETHVTRGTLISEGTVVTPVSTEMGLFSQTGKKVLMRNQLEIAGITSHGAFFQPGDSGSGVFFVDRTGMGQELTCIGMAIGSTSNGTAIVTPILDILDSLQLPRSLWQFP